MAVVGEQRLQDRSEARGARRSARPGYVVPPASEVVAAAESLYADRLLPLGRILLRRIRERSATAPCGGGAAEDTMPLIDPRGLRQVCEACDRLVLRPEEGKEYSVLIAGRLPDFVDVSSPVDCYRTEMWEQLAAYLESSAAEDVELPGGRYACAQALVGRRLPFLEGVPFGEVCHIVQLALSHRSLLGYIGGNIVPFCRSLESVKRQHAARQQPVAPTKKAGEALRLATLEEAREGLRDILSSSIADSQPGAITLSDVKRLFRSRLGLDLSETALGCGRMSELLQDQRFGDVCRLELRGKAQFVVQRQPCTAAALPPAHCADACGAWKAGPSSHADDEASVRLSPGARLLSSYVRQLLELSLADRRDALRALSEHRASGFSDELARPCSPELPELVPACMSRCSSGSCSTGDGSASHSDDDSSVGARSERRLSAASSLRPPPGLAPPLGLEELVL